MSKPATYAQFQEVIRALAKHYRMEPSDLREAIVQREAATLLALSDLSRQENPDDFVKLLERRDNKLGDIMTQVFEQLSSINEQIEACRTTIAEVRKARAVLATKFEQVFGQPPPTDTLPKPVA